MSVEVVRDLAHVGVDRPIALPEHPVCDLAQLREHLLEVVCRRIYRVPAPDDHRDPTYLAVGDPADVVLVVPGGEASRFTQFASASAVCARGEPAAP